MARSDPSSTPSPSTPIFVVCEICNRKFRSQMAWDRKVRHMNEDHPTPSPPRKRSRGHEQTMGVVRPTPRAPVETPALQVNSVEALLQIEDQVFALLRLNKYSQEQERANGALVQAIVTCPDPARVGSIKATLQAFEIYCFSRAVSQFPITDLKVALFLADHLGFAPSPSTLQARASVPPVQAAALSFPPGHPVCVSVLSRWLDDLQNCCTVTAFCFLPGGQVDNLAAHQAVRVVMEEARRSDAQEVLDAVRKSLMDGGMEKFYRSTEGVTGSVFGRPVLEGRRVVATGGEDHLRRPVLPYSGGSSAPTTGDRGGGGVAGGGGGGRGGGAALPRTGPLPSVTQILANMPMHMAATLPQSNPRPISDNYFSTPRRPTSIFYSYDHLGRPPPPLWTPFAPGGAGRSSSLPSVGSPPRSRRPPPEQLHFFSNDPPENSRRRKRVGSEGREDGPPLPPPVSNRLAATWREGTPEVLELPPARMNFAELLNHEEREVGKKVEVEEERREEK